MENALRQVNSCPECGKELQQVSEWLRCPGCGWSEEDEGPSEDELEADEAMTDFDEPE
jgi:hypothetical protein